MAQLHIWDKSDAQSAQPVGHAGHEASISMVDKDEQQLLRSKALRLVAANVTIARQS